MENRITLLKVQVGSKAFGLDNPSSDDDTIEVYADLTSDVLSLFYGEDKGKHTIQDENDCHSYEIKHFLKMSLKSNPFALIAYRAPIIESTAEGEELRSLLRYVYDPDRLYKAVEGCIKSQRNRKRTYHEIKKWYCESLKHYNIAYQLFASPNHTFYTDFKNCHFPLVRKDYEHMLDVLYKGLNLEVEEMEKNIDNKLWSLRIWRDYAKSHHIGVQNIDKINDFLFKIRNQFL